MLNLILMEVSSNWSLHSMSKEEIIVNNRDRISAYEDAENVTDEYGCELSPCDDDYEVYCDELEDLTNPLSDDYCKYDNE